MQAPGSNVLILPHEAAALAEVTGDKEQDAERILSTILDDLTWLTEPKVTQQPAFQWLQLAVIKALTPMRSLHTLCT